MVMIMNTYRVYWSIVRMALVVVEEIEERKRGEEGAENAL